MKTKPLFLSLLGVVATILALSFSGKGGLKYPTGAPAGYTGSPGDGQNCTACHGGTATNTSGIITTDIPATGYVAGMTYNITVSFSGTGKKGFELSPQKMTGEQVGTLIAGTGSQLLSGGKYITHTQASIAATATWDFQWQAPAQPGSGPVTFYLAHVVKKPNVFLSNLTVDENYHVGIPEIAREQKLDIFPNPVKDHFTVKFTLPDAQGGTVSLLPITGKANTILYNGPLMQGENVLNFDVPAHIVPGLYILKMQARTETGTTKILIRR
jgi:hypothetical protein